MLKMPSRVVCPLVILLLICPRIEYLTPEVWDTANHPFFAGGKKFLGETCAFSLALSNLVYSLLIEFARGGARPRRDEYVSSSLHRLTSLLEVPVPGSPDPGVRKTDWLWTIFPRM